MLEITTRRGQLSKHCQRRIGDVLRVSHYHLMGQEPPGLGVSEFESEMFPTGSCFENLVSSRWHCVGRFTIEVVGASY